MPGLLSAAAPAAAPGQAPAPPVPGLPLAPVAGLPIPGTQLIATPEQPTDTRPGPGRIWTLTSSNLKLTGVRYRGHAKQDVLGKPVETLHFTVDRLDITDLVQRGDLANGKIEKASGAPGSVSTITQGPTDLYVLQLTGTLTVAGFPLIRLTLSPETVPDIDLGFLKIPEITFKDVVSRNVYLTGGNLHIPGSAIVLE